MNPGLKLDLPSAAPAAPRRAASETPPACENCRGTGHIALGVRPSPDWGTAEGLRAALERGDCCLCFCAEGRWWYTWFLELSRPLKDRDGRPVETGFRLPSRGVPDFGERAA